MKYFFRIRLFFISLYFYFFRFLRLTFLNPVFSVVIFRLLPFAVISLFGYVFVVAGDMGDVLFHPLKAKSDLLPFFNYAYDSSFSVPREPSNNLAILKHVKFYQYLQLKLAPEFVCKQIHWSKEETPLYYDFFARLILAHPVVLAADEVTPPLFTHFGKGWFIFENMFAPVIDPRTGLEWHGFYSLFPFFGNEIPLPRVVAWDINRLCKADVLDDFGYLSYSSRNFQSDFFDYSPADNLVRCHPFLNQSKHKSFFNSTDFSVRQGFYSDDSPDFDSDGFMSSKRKSRLSWNKALGDLSVDNEFVLRYNRYSHDMHYRRPDTRLFSQIRNGFTTPLTYDSFYLGPPKRVKPLILVDSDFFIKREL